MPYYKGCTLPETTAPNPGHCNRLDCGKPLPKGRRTWCSNACGTLSYNERMREHDWNSARSYALHLAGHKCSKCGHDGKIPKEILATLPKHYTYQDLQQLIGEAYTAARESNRAREKAIDKLTLLYQLEVNHIEPRNGLGYRAGCHNHQSNLEVLCHACHAKVTAEQARERARKSKKQQELNLE